MADRLAAVLKHCALSAEVYYTGQFCETALYDDACGYIHFLRDGRVTVTSDMHPPLVLDEPSCLLYLRPASHRLSVAEGEHADLICARFRFGADSETPWFDLLPTVVNVPLASGSGLQPVVELLVAEAQENSHGRQACLDRLSELLLIQLLRHFLETGTVSRGLLGGLSDSRISLALGAMHGQPGYAWTLEELAEQAGMSRARFAVRFREIVGETPLAYLTAWRISLAQVALRRGTPATLIAAEVGYGSAVAFSRAFTAHVGRSPRQWLSDLNGRAMAGPVAEGV